MAFGTLRPAMSKFVIEGGYPLSGTVVPAGNKNAALPALAACLLTEEEVVLRNIPRISDVEAMLALLEHFGAEVEWREENVVALCAANIDADIEVPRELTERIRASFLVAGPLLARCGSAVLPPPGGDVIGRRRLDPHLDAFRALGATVASNRVYRIEAGDGLRACDFFMDEPSVMATENALMAAALTPGSTVIHNAASEPHVQDLSRLLLQMGARIEGIGTNQLIVHGSEQLGGADFRIGSDHIEIGSFIALAAATHGEIRIKDCVRDDLRATVPGDQDLRIRDDEGQAVSKIEDGPWPAFPADLTSIALALATQAEGMVLIFEKMFENRLFFVDKLVTMGARVILCDPHRAVVSGPSRLHGERVDSPDIRAGMAMLIAALCAEGRTEIGNIRQIDRGYERIDERLRLLGARIERRGGERVAA
jgi:UDP-N-acetylglucosamine 1-carboxyvinyltransferase